MSVTGQKSDCSDLTLLASGTNYLVNGDIGKRSKRSIVYCTSGTRCECVMVDWSSWGSGKSGENPGLCRNCDEAIASSQNTASLC
jgi:hypothetical protein